MRFSILRRIDSILGTLLFFTIVPLCNLIAFLLPKPRTPPTSITILKLHGGGSLLIAMPMLLGIRARYPHAQITLVGTAETKKFAELTKVFDSYILIESGSLKTLVKSGYEALRACRRHDVFIDLEPHSALAAVFTPLTFAAQRFGFVRARELRRAQSYTTPVYFNLHAPIYIFYEQIAALLGAAPATVEECWAAIKLSSDGITSILTPTYPRPAIYISAFTSRLSPERMMPVSLWIEQLRKEIGLTRPFTLILGGGADEAADANEFAREVKVAMPLASVIQACGLRTLREAIADIDAADMFWGVDSGPLHIARLLGKKCSSFWGPSNPAYRLRPIARLDEKIFYRNFPCSPCVHLSAQSPCKGDNQCMKKLFSDEAPAPITSL